MQIASLVNQRTCWNALSKRNLFSFCMKQNYILKVRMICKAWRDMWEDYKVQDRFSEMLQQFLNVVLQVMQLLLKMQQSLQAKEAHH
jgi:hypothetical protein